MFLSRCISRERSEDTLQRLLEKVNRVPLHEDFHFRVTNGQRAEVKRVLHCEGISLLSASDSPQRSLFLYKRIPPTTTNLMSNLIPLILLLAIFTPVHLVLFISQDENMIQPLLDRSDAAGIFTADDIFDLTRKFQRFF